jgi:hypothetical protein
MDLDGFGWIWMDLDGLRMDLDGFRMDLDGFGFLKSNPTVYPQISDSNEHDRT